MATRDANLDVNIRVNDRRAQNQIKNLQSTVIRFAGAVTASLAVIRTAAFPIQAAAEFDKELRNVQKTTGFTAEETRALGKELIELSKATNVATTDLARIAAVAGQLGLGGEGANAIAQFTETASRLASVLDITAETAATSVAKISNVFNVSLNESERIGSAINELSNQSTASGEELINIVARIGSVAGLTLDQVLALAAAGKNFGLQTEVIGTSFVKVFSNLTVRAEEFARLLNITTQDWTARVRQDGVGAFNDVLVKLQQFDDVFQSTFIKTNFGGGRIFSVVDKFRRDLAAGGDELERYRALAGTAFDDGTSAIREQDTVLGGAIAQWEILRNVIFSIGESVGSQFLEGIVDQIQELSLALQSDEALAFFNGVADAVSVAGSAILEGLKFVVEYSKEIGFLVAAWAGFVALNLAQRFISFATSVKASGAALVANVRDVQNWTTNILAAASAREKLNQANNNAGRTDQIVRPNVVTAGAEGISERIQASKQYQAELQKTRALEAQLGAARRRDSAAVKAAAESTKVTSQELRTLIQERTVLEAKLTQQIEREAQATGRSAAGHRARQTIIRQEIAEVERGIVARNQYNNSIATSVARTQAETTALANSVAARRRANAELLKSAGIFANFQKAGGGVRGTLAVITAGFGVAAKAAAGFLLSIIRLIPQLLVFSAITGAITWLYEWATESDNAEVSTQKLTEAQEKQIKVVRDLGEEYAKSLDSKKAFNELAINVDDDQEVGNFAEQAARTVIGGEALLQTQAVRQQEEQQTILNLAREFRGVQDQIITLQDRRLALEERYGSQLQSNIFAESDRGQSILSELNQIDSEVTELATTLSKDLEFRLGAGQVDVNDIVDDVQGTLDIALEASQRSADAYLANLAAKSTAGVRSALELLFSNKSELFAALLLDVTEEGQIRGQIEGLEGQVSSLGEEASKTQQTLEKLYKARLDRVTASLNSDPVALDRIKAEIATLTADLNAAVEEEGDPARRLINLQQQLEVKQDELKVAQQQIKTQKELLKIQKDSAQQQTLDAGGQVGFARGRAGRTLDDIVEISSNISSVQKRADNLGKRIIELKTILQTRGEGTTIFKRAERESIVAARQLDRFESTLDRLKTALTEAKASRGFIDAQVTRELEKQEKSLERQNEDLAKAEGFSIRRQKLEETRARILASGAPNADTRAGVIDDQIRQLDLDEANTERATEFRRSLEDIAVAYRAVGDTRRQLDEEANKDNPDADRIQLLNEQLEAQRVTAVGLAKDLQPLTRQFQTFNPINPIAVESVDTAKEFAEIFKEIGDIGIDFSGSATGIEALKKSVGDLNVLAAESALDSTTAIKPQIEAQARLYNELFSSLQQTSTAAKTELENIQSTIPGIGVVLFELEQSLDTFNSKFGEVGENAFNSINEQLRSGKVGADTIKQFTDAITVDTSNEGISLKIRPFTEEQTEAFISSVETQLEKEDNAIKTELEVVLPEVNPYEDLKARIEKASEDDPITVQVKLESTNGTIAAKDGGLIGTARTFATGGFVSGRGTSTSDSIPAWLSNGEYVMDANSVRHFGSSFFQMLQRMSSAGAKLPGFATGGLVGGQSMGEGLEAALTNALKTGREDTVTLDLGIGEDRFRVTSPRDQVAGLTQALQQLGG